jgi:hypothetical protein
MAKTVKKFMAIPRIIGEKCIVLQWKKQIFTMWLFRLSQPF